MGDQPLGQYRVSGAAEATLISPTPAPGMPFCHGPCVWFPLAACTGFAGMSTQSRSQYHELPGMRLFVITPCGSPLAVDYEHTGPGQNLTDEGRPSPLGNILLLGNAEYS